MNKTCQANWGSFTTTPINRLSFSERLFAGAALIAAAVLAFPQFAAAHTLSSDPILEFEVKDQFNLNTISLPPLPLAEDIAIAKALDDSDERVVKLREYLQSKKSPMAEHAGFLLTQYHYRLIIGISFAESNFCKRNIRPYNCWGIGGGRPETYSSYPHAFARANELIQKYQDKGMTTPKLMRNSWVGWHNDSWIVAVNQAVVELEELGL